jgi:hypothetical protein
VEVRTGCPICEGTGLVGDEPCLDCNEELGGEAAFASELYAREGSPCATCTRSYMSLKQAAGTTLGFDAGGGLALRVCRLGREPVLSEGGTGESWCDDHRPFATVVPLVGDDLDLLQRECSRGFLGDLAQGVRPLPRSSRDLRWYDRGFREGWLPPHRVEVDGGVGGSRIVGAWEQFVVVGVTPAFGDGHTPAVGEAILQAKDQRSFLLVRDPSAERVSGPAQPHGWWASQVSSGAALPLEHPVEAQRHARVLVLRGGERVLRGHAYRYLPTEAIDAELDRMAAESLASAEAAMRRGQAVVAGLCVRRGLRARADHAGLKSLEARLGDDVG